MVSLLAAAVSFTACSDDNDDPTPLPVVGEASVTLELGEVTDETIEFTLTPENAVKAAWIYFEEGAREVTAEQVLNYGTSADAEGAQTLVAEPLSPGTAYVIYAAVEGEDGTKVLSEPLTATTTGEVVVYEEFFGESAVATFYAANNWGLTLTDAEGNTATFDLYVESGSRDYLASTDFTVAEGTAPGTLGKGEYSYMVVDGEKLAIEEGELFVEVDLEEDPIYYLVEGQLTAGGRTFSIIYEGEVEGTKNPNAPIEIVCTNAVLMDINDPQPGEFYVKLNDDAWHYEIVFDFQAASDAAYLPANTYSFDWGTLLSNTMINDYVNDPYNPYITLSECEIDVMFEDNVYTIEANAVGNNEKVYHIVFEGSIVNMPEVVELGQVYAQFGWDPDFGWGQMVLADVPLTNIEELFATFKWYALFDFHSQMEYPNNFYELMSYDEVDATGATDFISTDESYVMYRDDVYSEPMDAKFAGGKSFVDFMSLMPADDNNMIQFQLVSEDGSKVWVGSYMGPLYGGGSVSTDPVDYPIYGVTAATLLSHEGNCYQIRFATLGGPMTINFYTDTFGGGAYHFDANGGSDKTFNGAYIEYAMDMGDDKVYTFESGSIGIVAQSDGSYLFQFDNVIGRAADGSAVNLGPVNGVGYQTSFTTTISGL